jgi:IS5 family transposase
VVYRPRPTLEKQQGLCLDAGYIGRNKEILRRGYTPHVRPRGEEKQLLQKNPDFKARRWVVEVTHSWVNRFRKLLVRFEKKDRNYIALLSFAFAVIVWRKLLPVHNNMVIVG